MIAKAAELVQGDKFTHDGQLYRVVVNIKENDNQRKIFAYHTDGQPGMAIIQLHGEKMVPVQEKDAPPAVWQPKKDEEDAL